MNFERLKACAVAGVPRVLDVYFARWLCQTAGEENDAVALAAALVSWRVSEGDVCVDLSRYAGGNLFKEEHDDPGISAPDLDAWLNALNGSKAVAGPGAVYDVDTEVCPLVLEGTRLYLARYAWYEKTLAEEILRLAGQWADYDAERLKAGLDQYFSEIEGEAVNWQRVAAAMAVFKRFCIISGGPGTGKTTTVAGILALFRQQSPDNPLRIRLAAPTGKAAARITESIRQTCEMFHFDKQTRNALSLEAVTLHRLLGVRPFRSMPLHGPDNPLPVDVLIIDEASMIDLPLMHRIVSALPAAARLILLGDKDQLASVEAGSVFADLCAGSEGRGYSRNFCERLRGLCRFPDAPVTVSPLGDCVVLLRKSYRFDGDSGIGRLSAAIRRGGNPGEILYEHTEASAALVWTSPSPAVFPERLSEEAVKRYGSLFEAENVREALDRLEAFRVLCALRKGPTGVEGINRIIQEALFEKGVIPLQQGIFRGCPILVTRNDYALNLSNGDVGIVWPDDEQGGILKICFRQPDGTIKKIAPHRITEYEVAFALTVHKAQGSEFNRILLILPLKDARVLSRELFYTGVTRARTAVEIWGPMKIIKTCTARPTIRASGLVRRLWHRPLSG
jgi:exodeoxyribonuclease V alpha subunit